MLARHCIIPVNTVNPGWMRAPGENIRTYALETAMDELAYEVGLDPIELRLRNWASQDPKANIPWSTRRFGEGYAAGANAFGWARRNPEPSSMRRSRTDWLGDGSRYLPQVVVWQVKEKFGGLRFYIGGGYEFCRAAVQKAQTASLEICEVCGRPGALVGERWVSTRCDEHVDWKPIESDDKY